MESWMLSVLWAVVAVAALIVELSTTALVSIWFVAGALGALVMSLMGLSLWVQAGVFAGISLLLFGVCRQWLEDHFRPRPSVPSLIGHTGFVSTPIVGGAGRVTVSGKDWKASSDQDLEAGTPVKVIALKGVTLTVQQMEK